MAVGPTRLLGGDIHDNGEAAVKVSVDYDLCESNAICMGIAPDVFEVRDDDYLYLLTDQPDPSQHDAVRLAAERCPRQAILIDEG